MNVVKGGKKSVQELIEDLETEGWSTVEHIKRDQLLTARQMSLILFETITAKKMTDHWTLEALLEEILGLQHIIDNVEAYYYKFENIKSLRIARHKISLWMANPIHHLY